MEIEKQFLAGFLDDLNNKRVVLTSLPETALGVRRVMEDLDATPEVMAQAINLDPVLSARLLYAANEDASAEGRAVFSVRDAIAGLGAAQVRNIITSLIVEQLYQEQSTSAPIKARLKALWAHSARLSIYCHAFARRFTELNPDEALVAGLIHDIGVLPILMRAELYPELPRNEDTLKRVIKRLHTLTGPAVLQEWNCPSRFVAVAAEHEDVWRKRPGPVDLVDVVIVANLHSHLGTVDHPLSKIKWNEVPAFAKLGITPQEGVRVMAEAEGDYMSANRVLDARSRPLPPVSAPPAAEVIDITIRAARGADVQSAARYVPEEFLLGRLLDLRQTAADAGSPAGITVKAGAVWAPIVMRADGRSVMTPLSGDELRRLCATPLSRLQVNTMRPYEIDAALKQSVERDVHPMETFFWNIAAWTAQGRVPPDVDLRESIKLKHWPNLTRLPESPNAMRIAALMIGQPHPLPLIAKVLHLPQREVFDFYSAAWSVGLIEGAVPAVQMPRELARPAAPQRGLFGRILKRLGVAG